MDAQKQQHRAMLSYQAYRSPTVISISLEFAASPSIHVARDKRRRARRNRKDRAEWSRRHPMKTDETSFSKNALIVIA